jgi:hypothetical protein
VHAPRYGPGPRPRLGLGSRRQTLWRKGAVPLHPRAGYPTLKFVHTAVGSSKGAVVASSVRPLASRGAGAAMEAAILIAQKFSDHPAAMIILTLGVLFVSRQVRSGHTRARAPYTGTV